MSRDHRTPVSEPRVHSVLGWWRWGGIYRGDGEISEETSEDVERPLTPTPQKSVFFLLRLLFIMPQVTCLAQGGCSVNIFELSTLGGMVLQDMIAFLFNMILTNRVSMGCTLRRYAIFFPSVTTRPTSHVRWSPGIQLLVPRRAQRLECGRLSPILIIQVI